MGETGQTSLWAAILIMSRIGCSYAVRVAPCHDISRFGSRSRKTIFPNHHDRDLVTPTHENHPLSTQWGGSGWGGCIFTVKWELLLYGLSVWLWTLGLLSFWQRCNMPTISMFYGIIILLFLRLKKNTTCHISMRDTKEAMHRLPLKTELFWQVSYLPCSCAWFRFG